MKNLMLLPYGHLLQSASQLSDTDVWQMPWQLCGNVGVSK